MHYLTQSSSFSLPLKHFFNCFIEISDCCQAGELNIGREVLGVTWLENKIYVLCPEINTVYVYSDQVIENQSDDISSDHRLEDEEFEIDDMQKPVDVTSCALNKSLFISDYEGKCIVRVQLNDKQQDRFQVQGCPWKMSTSALGELMILTKADVCWLLIILRTDDFHEKKNMALPREIMNPEHVVQTLKGQFIICYERELGDFDHRQLHRHVSVISKLSENGEILSTFNSGFDHPVNLNWPSYIALADDDQVFIADRMNHRVLLFDSRLRHAQVLLSNEKNKLCLPNMLCYVKEKRLLIVGQRSPLSVSSESDVFGSVSFFKF